MTTVLTKYRLTGLIILTILAGALAVMFSSSLGASILQPSGWQVVRTHNFGAWSYVAKREESGAVSAEVHFDSTSLSGVQAFAKANQALTMQLAKEGGKHPALIIFPAPLDPDSYRAWFQHAGISYVVVAYIRAIDERNILNVEHPLPPIQIGVPSNSNDPLPQTRLDDALRTTSKDLGAAVTVQGIVGFQAMVDAQYLPAIAADPQVLIVDVTTSAVRSDLAASGIANGNEADVYDPIPIFNIQDMIAQTPH